MKKFTFLFMWAVLGTIVFAQPKFGIKAGLNLSNLKGEDESMDARVAPLFGAFAEFGISDKLAFHPELVYSMEGAKDKYSEVEAGYDYSSEETIKLGYLNVPLLLKYKIGSGISVLAGPQVGFLLDAKSKWELSEDGENTSGTEDIKEYLKSTNFGLSFGAGWECEKGIGIDARYNLGLSNIYDGEGDGEMKTKGFQIAVFYKF
ncbi:MAG: porin family protein [Breznakibacter sp.]